MNEEYEVVTTECVLCGTTEEELDEFFTCRACRENDVNEEELFNIIWRPAMPKQAKSA